MNPSTRLMAAAAAGVVLTGCAATSTTPNLDARFGDVHRSTAALQTHDLQAPSRRVTMVTDGKITAGTHKMWHEWYGFARSDSQSAFREGVKIVPAGAKN